MKGDVEDEGAWEQKYEHDVAEWFDVRRNGQMSVAG